MQGPATDSNVISVPVKGSPYCTYFGDGRLKWSRLHRTFHMNVVTAGEQPRGMFESPQRFAILHVYLPHTTVERIAVESTCVSESRSIALIDPMCSRDPHIEATCRQIARELAEPDRCARLMVDALIQALTIRLLRSHSNISGSTALGARKTFNHRDWRLKRAIDYLEAHLAEDLGLDDVAGVAGISVSRLTTLFRDGTGEPPHRYLMRRRFERACELLGDPTISIGDVAYRCGFANPQHLAAVMRQRLAMTPTTYRRQLLS
jgi:AraC family transcriptional regulator